MALSQITLSPKMQATFDRIISQIEQPDEIEGNRYVEGLRRRIQTAEINFGMSSETMSSRLASGEIEETSDICDWLMDINALKHAESAR